MKFAAGGAGAGSRLFPPSGDDEPNLGLGPPPLDLFYGIRSYTMVRGAAAAVATIVHLILGAVTGWPVWFVIAGLSVVHALVAIPVGSAAARTRPILTLFADGGAMFVATLVVGDPVVLAFWVPMLLLSTVIYLGGRTGQVGVAFSLGIVLLAFAARWLGIIDNELDGSTVRLYALLSAVSVAIVAFLYLYAVGGAVRRKDRALALAEEATLEARRQADIRAGQLEAVFENTPIGLSLQAEDSRFLYVNPRTAQILGIDRDHMLRHGAADLVSDGMHEVVLAEIETSRRTGRPFELEYEIRTPAGAAKWIRHAGHGIETELGTGFVSTVEDLTDQRLATARSRRFAAALEATEDLVLIWDRSGVILHANRSFQRFWGTDGDPAGRLLTEVVGDENARGWTADAQDHGGANEVDVERADGTTVAMSLLVVASDPGDDGRAAFYTAALRDIGEVVEARRQLEGLIRSKDQFIASVSHELRTPLAAVMGMASILSTELEALSHDEIVELARHVAEQSGDLAAMVEDLLTAARADAGVLMVACKPVDLADVLNETLASLPPNLSSSVRIESVPGVMVEADATRTRQILRNLLTNASRYGGPTVEVLVIDTAGEGRVVVRDDGGPIPVEARQRMFEAYGRAHERVGTPDSVGLGLTVSRRLARLMGGDVSYEHDGVWSTFTVTLPGVR
jgi:PAS domain S-box-containing protein